MLRWACLSSALNMNLPVPPEEVLGHKGPGLESTCDSQEPSQSSWSVHHAWASGKAEETGFVVSEDKFTSQFVFQHSTSLCDCLRDQGQAPGSWEGASYTFSKGW